MLGRTRGPKITPAEELRILEQGPPCMVPPGGPNDGELTYQVVSLLKMQAVAIRFTEPVAWIGMTLPSAKEMRRLLDEAIADVETASPVPDSNPTSGN